MSVWRRRVRVAAAAGTGGGGGGDGAAPDAASATLTPRGFLCGGVVKRNGNDILCIYICKVRCLVEDFSKHHGERAESG